MNSLGVLTGMRILRRSWAWGCQALPLHLPKPETSAPGGPSRHASPSPLPEVLTDFAQKVKSPSCRQDKDGGSLTPMGPWRWLQGVTLTEVQELFDRERRRGEAGVALDLLGDRLLEQPVEEPHLHRSSVQIRRAFGDQSRGRRRAARRRRRRRGFTSTWSSALAPAAARRRGTYTSTRQQLDGSGRLPAGSQAPPRKGGVCRRTYAARVGCEGR